MHKLLRVLLQKQYDEKSTHVIINGANPFLFL
jgi:hypothetical protein